MMDFLSIPYVGVMVGVFFTAMIAIVQQKIRKRKKPRYVKTFKNIVSQAKTKYDGLEFYFQKELLHTFSETEFYFWNYGSQSIRSSHLLKNDPLGIIIDNKVKVYRVQYATTKKLNNTFEINIQPFENFLLLNFDAISKKEGFYIKLLHSGNICGSIELVGDIDDSEIDKIEKTSFSSIFDTIFARPFFAALYILAGAGTLSGLILFFILSEYTDLLSILILASSCSVIFTLIWATILLILKGIIPKGLRNASANSDNYTTLNIENLSPETPSETERLHTHEKTH